ncbi:MAG: type I-B CRISPR-associated protein Cas5b, partial [bacterium]|nr:type I-B CRISPR-associated protein Cas5b [bacterium]
MKVLRIRIFQPHAHYRIPFAFIRRYTYPIPPYSTVIGFLCNFLGIVRHDDERFNLIKEGLYLAIYGNFDSITKEYVWYRNLNKEAHNNRFGAINLRQINNEVEHPGGQIPVDLFVLENVKIIVYVFHEDQKVIESIYEKIADPNSLAGTLHLGRAED